MKIGLISDTHIPGGATTIPDQVYKAFDGVDLILHAGNIYIPSVLDCLEQIAPVRAVGSTDPDHPERRLQFSMEGQGDPRVKPEDIFQLEGHTIGLVHNLQLRGMSDEIRPGIIANHKLPEGAITEMVTQFFDTPVDIAIFGRTCYGTIEIHEEILFINPGSPTLPRNLRKLGNVAVLDLTPDAKVARLIELSDLI